MSTTIENKILMKVVNETAYHAETSDQVIQWLETSRQRNQRIRIFLGDTKTGRDWMEEHDIIGHIGRSMGPKKVPLLINNIRSTGGSAIIDHCIVRITTKDSSGKIQDVYRHPNYHLPTFTIQASGHEEVPVGVWEVGSPMENAANFKDREQAKRWIAFIKGERNSK